MVSSINCQYLMQVSFYIFDLKCTQNIDVVSYKSGALGFVHTYELRRRFTLNTIGHVIHIVSMHTLMQNMPTNYAV